MKKLIALLFVCAGLTAMAVNPHVNISNVKTLDGKPVKTNMVMKSNTLSKQLSAPVMQANKNVMSVQKFFKERNLTPNDNMLMKKAPRRVSEAEVLGNKLVFMEQYSYNSDSGKVVEDPIFYYGGWNAEIVASADADLEACVYFTSIPFHFNVNYEAKTAEMLMEMLGGWQWSDTVVSGRTTTIEDTTEYLFIWDENYMFDDSDDAEPANLQGVIYEDGSVYFPEGWTLYLIDFTTKRVIRNGQTQTTNDTTAGLLCGFMRDTYLMTPSGTHSYVDTYDNSEGENDVYMFQYYDAENDRFCDTALVWNMFGLGNRGNYFFIDGENGIAQFPNVQYGGDMASQRSYCESNYAGYDWSDADHVTFMAYDESTGKPTSSVDYIEGTITPEAVTFPYISWTWWGYDTSQGGWVYLYVPPYSNNVLTFTNGDYFLLGTTETPVITYEVGDENVVVTAAPADDLETEIILCIYDAENETLTPVDNPYTVARTNEDQTIIFAALAQAYGKRVSEWAVAEITIPALEGPSFLRGDVDMDGSVGISDVSALIDYLLSHDDTDVSVLAADCDEDGSVGISDVSALIDYLLAHEWE